jgi:hypothetical protein
VTLNDVIEKVIAADDGGDWREVLKWEGRMEEMMEHQTDDASCNGLLETYSDAHRLSFNATGSNDNLLSVVRLETRRAEVLGKMQRFRDQGQALCRAADHLRSLDTDQEDQESEGYFQRARKIAEAHGFFSVECESCFGLGKLARAGGRDEEGVELLRNALVCVPLCEGGDEPDVLDVKTSALELDILSTFTTALFDTHAIDEAEPLVARYRETAKADSDTQGRLSYWEFDSLLMSARLHEVLCTCAPVRDSLGTARALHFTKADSVSHRCHHARIKTHALVEPHALARHAGDLKRPRGRCALCSTSCATTRR